MLVKGATGILLQWNGSPVNKVSLSVCHIQCLSTYNKCSQILCTHWNYSPCTNTSFIYPLHYTIYINPRNTCVVIFYLGRIQLISFNLMPYFMYSWWWFVITWWNMLMLSAKRDNNRNIWLQNDPFHENGCCCYGDGIWSKQPSSIKFVSYTVQQGYWNVYERHN